MRVFISMDIPKNILEKIKSIQKKIPEFEGKFTEAENLHLTLKFLGDVDEETLMKVRNRLREVKFKSFETQISEIGVFSPSFIKIVWLHMTNCLELQKEIDEKLSDLFEKEKRFMGHLTIARVKTIKNKKEFLEELGKVSFPKIEFKVKNFKLKKSTITKEGPVYENLEGYDLL